jgi:hypothetical protein
MKFSSIPCFTFMVHCLTAHTGCEMGYICRTLTVLDDRVCFKTDYSFFLMFVVPYILVTYMFNSSPTRCTTYIILFISFLTTLAVHVSGAICTHHQEYNCSVQP